MIVAVGEILNPCKDSRVLEHGWWLALLMDAVKSMSPSRLCGIEVWGEIRG